MLVFESSKPRNHLVLVTLLFSAKRNSQSAYLGQGGKQYWLPPLYVPWNNVYRSLHPHPTLALSYRPLLSPAIHLMHGKPFPSPALRDPISMQQHTLVLSKMVTLRQKNSNIHITLELRKHIIELVEMNLEGKKIYLNSEGVFLIQLLKLQLIPGEH